MSREPRHRSAIGWSSSGRSLAVMDADHPTAMTGPCGNPWFPVSYTRRHHAHHWSLLCSPITVRRSGPFVTIAPATIGRQGTYGHDVLGRCHARCRWMVASLAWNHREGDHGHPVNASEPLRPPSDGRGHWAAGIGGEAMPCSCTEHRTDPMPVTSRVASADRMQRHTSVAAHPIEALQEHTPERGRDASAQAPLDGR